MKKFELVVPAYNEEKNIESFLQRMLESATEFNFTPENFTLILVENGSKDRSFEVINEILHKNAWTEWVKVVRVIKNQGYGFGILAGLKETQAEIVGWSHADLQCDPRNAFIAMKLLEGQKQPKILVKGVRLGRDWKDRIVSRVFESLARLILGLRMYEMNAQPKIFPSRLLREMKNPPHTFALDLYLLYIAQKMNYEVMTISVFFPPRVHGASNWAGNFIMKYKNIFGMIRYMWTLLFTEGRA